MNGRGPLVQVTVLLPLNHNTQLFSSVAAVVAFDKKGYKKVATQTK